MKLQLTLLAGLAIAASSAFAMAQDTIDPATAISERQSLMRSMGGQMRGAANLTGEAAIEQAKTFIADFERLPTLFPEGSETGGNTEAAPSIWQQFDQFTALSNKGKTQAEAILAAAEAGDQAAYTTAVRGLAPVCGECHQAFRTQ